MEITTINFLTNNHQIQSQGEFKNHYIDKTDDNHVLIKLFQNAQSTIYKFLIGNVLKNLSMEQVSSLRQTCKLFNQTIGNINLIVSREIFDKNFNNIFHNRNTKYIYTTSIFRNSAAYHIANSLTTIVREQEDLKSCIQDLFQNGRSLAFAPDKIRNDCRSAMVALAQIGHESQSDNVQQSDEELIIKEALKIGEALKIDDVLQRNRLVVLEKMKASCRVLKAFMNWPVAMQIPTAQHIFAEDYSEVAQNDYDTVVSWLCKDPSQLKWISEHMKPFKKEIVLDVIENSLGGFNKIKILKYVPKKWMSDRNFVLQVIKRFGPAVTYADPSLRQDPLVILLAIRERVNYVDAEIAKGNEVPPIIAEGIKWQTLDDFSEERRSKYRGFFDNPLLHGSAEAEAIRDDYTMVMYVVERNALELQHASERLKGNLTIVFKAMESNIKALQYASDCLKKDRNFMCEAVRRHGLALEFADLSLKQDPLVVMYAVKHTREASAFASQELIALCTLFFNDPLNLQKMPDMVRDDYMAVMDAVKQNGLALQYASARLRDEFNIALAAVEQNVEALKYVSDSLKNNREFLLKLVEKQPKVLNIISELKGDGEFLVEAVAKNLAVLDVVPELKQDKKNLLEILKKNIAVLSKAPEEWKNDQTFILDAIERNTQVLQSAFVYKFKNNPQFNLSAVKRNGLVLQYVQSTLKNYEEIVWAAIEQNLAAVKFVSDKHKNYVSLMCAVIGKYPAALSHINPSHKHYQAISDRIEGKREAAQHFSTEKRENDLKRKLELEEFDEVQTNKKINDNCF